MVKKLVIVATLVLVIAAVIVGGVVFAIGSKSSSAAALRDYVGRQIVAVVNTHLEPTLDFETIDLKLPGTVRLTGARLVSPDGIDILDLDTMVITLAEAPSLGEPIHIAKIEIDGGCVNLIQNPATGQFKGLQPLVKHGVRTGTTKVPTELSLSTVLRLEHITLKNITLNYDEGSGSPPMVVEGFAADLAITPTNDGPGWYDMAVQTGRSPGLTLDLDGAFNIDSFVARLTKADGTMTLDESTISSLPPQLQSVLRSFDATGQAEVAMVGTVPLRSLTDADVRIDVSVNQANVAAGEYRLPVESIRAGLVVADGIARLENAVARTLDGTAEITGQAEITQPGIPTTANWTLTNLQLREALRSAVPEGENPKLAGLLTGQGAVSMNATDALAAISGQGEIHVRNGRLLVLPGLAEIIQKIGTATAGGGTFNHKADATFTLAPAGINVTESEVITGVLAARATGTIGYTGALDLIVNAGPLERLQSALGKVGDLIGKVTDQLVKYRVQGTLAEPKVTVAPLGIGG